MELNELKATWQQAGTAGTTPDKLTGIIKTGKHLQVVRNMKRKLLLEAVIMALLLFFFYDIFDGDKKPVYASVALVAGASFYFLSNLMSFFKLQQVVQAGNIRDSLTQLVRSMRQMKVMSLTAMVFFALTLLVFFTSAIDLDLKKMLFVGALLLVVLVQVYLSGRMWNNWINKVAQQVEELEE